MTLVAETKVEVIWPMADSEDSPGIRLMQTVNTGRRRTRKRNHVIILSPEGARMLAATLLDRAERVEKGPWP